MLKPSEARHMLSGMQTGRGAALTRPMVDVVVLVLVLVLKKPWVKLVVVARPVLVDGVLK